MTATDNSAQASGSPAAATVSSQAHLPPDTQTATVEPRPTASATDQGWWRRMRTAAQTFLFGYDFFISYRHADGAACARSLHAQLGKKFDCFLDELHYEAGHNLPLMQSQALKRSRKLLLIVSPLAHRPPARGIDWLLAEVREFKHLANSRKQDAAIVPIGTLHTLSPAAFPDSKVLPEIPALEAGNLCILDGAVECRGSISSATIDKIDNDFRALRRRQVRRIASTIAAVVVACALSFGTVAGLDRIEAQRAATLERAFRLLNQGPAATENDITSSYLEALNLLVDLGLDPVMAQHGLFGQRLDELQAESIAQVDGEVSTITVSDDGKWLLVVYDYQAPNGSPEPEQIPDKTAFGVLDIASRTWTLRQKLSSPVGAELYQATVNAFLPPHHVILRTLDSNGQTTIQKVSLKDGLRSPVDAPAITTATTTATTPPATTPVDDGPAAAARGRIAEILAPENLFTTSPDDGIDMEYGPRVVESIDITSPDGRTRLIGTYEGRLMLLDVENGLRRGEILTSGIFAGAYAPHGKRAYFADYSQLWEVESEGWPGVTELPVPLPKGEGVALATVSDDGSMVALVTATRLMARAVGASEWLTWKLPRPLGKAAALRVDKRRSRIDLVTGDDATIMSVDFSSAQSHVEVVPRPGTPQPSVAWLDESGMAWIVGTTWSKGTAQIHGVPLPGSKSKARNLDIAQPGADSASPEDARIHALAKLGEQVILFHGDDSTFDDSGRNLENEQMLRIPLAAGAQPENRVVFESEFNNNGPDPVSTITHVSSVLASSTANAIFVTTEFEGAFEIGSNGTPTRRKKSLFLAEHPDGVHSYAISIDGEETDRWLDIRHVGTQTSLRYQLPWAFRHPPDFTAIAGGSKVMLASAYGEIMLFDVGARAPK